MHPRENPSTTASINVNGMAFLIRRLAVALRRSDPGNDLARIAFAHLDRVGLDQGEPMLLPALFWGGNPGGPAGAAQGRPLRWDMVTLGWVDDRGIQALVRRVPEKDLVRALHDPALQNLRERFLRNVTRRHGERLLDEWSWMTWDAEATMEAQDRVLDVLIRMENEGAINLSATG